MKFLKMAQSALTRPKYNPAVTIDGECSIVPTSRRGPMVEAFDQHGGAQCSTQNR